MSGSSTAAGPGTARRRVRSPRSRALRLSRATPRPSWAAAWWRRLATLVVVVVAAGGVVVVGARRPWTTTAAQDAGRTLRHSGGSRGGGVVGLIRAGVVVRVPHELQLGPRGVALPRHGTGSVPSDPRPHAGQSTGATPPRCTRSVLVDSGTPGRSEASHRHRRSRMAMPDALPGTGPRLALADRTFNVSDSRDLTSRPGDDIPPSTAQGRGRAVAARGVAAVGGPACSSTVAPSNRQLVGSTMSIPTTQRMSSATFREGANSNASSQGDPSPTAQTHRGGPATRRR